MKTAIKNTDALFSQWDRPDSPGCALALVKNGRALYKRGYGMANLEYDIPITASTVFEAASVSKQFTAAAAALLALAGRFSLEDDIRRYLPELPDFGGTITVRHLIYHTSGLRDQIDLLRLAGWRLDDVMTTADALEFIRRQRELNFPPGTQHLYCNTGYTLLALIVERLSGTPFTEFCAKSIFRPLGMKNTHFHDDYTMLVKNRAYSYVPDEGGGFRHSVLSFSTAGACGLFTTVDDLTLWAGNFRRGTVGGEELLGLLKTPGMLTGGKQIPYALGLFPGRYRGLEKFEHSGILAGFRSHFLYFPKEDFAVILLCNLGSMRPYLLARRVADIHLEGAFPEGPEPGSEIVTGENAVRIPAKRLAQKSGVYRSVLTGLTRRLRLRNGSLFLDLEPGYQLLPLSENRFRLADYPQAEFVFQRSGRKKQLQMCERMGSTAPVVYQQMEAAVPGPRNLPAYAGEYYSPELEVTYSIKLQGGQLLLSRPKYDASRLWPTVTDGFVTERPFTLVVPSGLDLLFVRDAKHKISGFRLFSCRARNIYFGRK